MHSFSDPPRPAKDLVTYVRLIKEARDYWGYAALAILMMICAAALEPLLPALMAPLIDESMIAKDAQAILMIPIYIITVYVAKGLAEFVGSVSSQYVAQKTVARIRQRLFTSQINLSIDQLESHAAGTFTSRVIFNCMQVTQAVSSAWMILIKDSLVLLGLIGFLTYTSWQLSLSILIVTPFVAWTIIQANQRMRTSNRQLQSWMGRLTGFIEDAEISIQEIKIFAGQTLQSDAFKKLNTGLVKEQMRVIKVQSLITPIVQIFTALAIGAVIIIGLKLNESALLTPGEFVAYITAMGMLFSPIKRLTGVSAVLQQGLAAADSIYEVLDAPSEGQECTGKVESSDQENAAKIEFIRVSYCYPNSSQPTLSEINLVVNPGEAMALIGPSGSGKSTVFALLAGFRRPNGGRILVNGNDINTWTVHHLRKHIALVPQQANLLNTTIRENLLLGKPAAKKDELMHAIELANLNEVISQLPRGLESEVGTRGNSLSGGQKQRICIARAFLKNAPILILDEPTSALDAESRDSVIEGLERLKADRTTIIVTHQPETLLSVDKTYRINRGKLILTNDSN